MRSHQKCTIGNSDNFTKEMIIYCLYYSVQYYSDEPDLKLQCGEVKDAQSVNQPSTNHHEGCLPVYLPWVLAVAITGCAQTCKIKNDCMKHAYAFRSRRDHIFRPSRPNALLPVHLPGQTPQKNRSGSGTLDSDFSILGTPQDSTPQSRRLGARRCVNEIWLG